MVNLSEIFLGGMMFKVQSGAWFDMGWTRIFCIDMGEGCYYW